MSREAALLGAYDTAMIFYESALQKIAAYDAFTSSTLAASAAHTSM